MCCRVTPTILSCRIYSGIAFLVLSRKNCLVRLHEFLKFHGAVGGGGGGEFDGFDSSGGFAVFLVEFVGGSACAIDVFDFRLGEDRCDVVWYNVFDACIASPDDSATVENVP